MGSRCSVQIHCRPQDVPRFESVRQLGRFDEVTHGEFDPALTTLCRYEVSCWNIYNDFPADIPYLGSRGAGDCGDTPEQFHCDGEGELQTVMTASEGYIVDFDEHGEPDRDDLDRIRNFLLEHRRILALTISTSLPPTPPESILDYAI